MRAHARNQREALLAYQRGREADAAARDYEQGSQVGELTGLP